MQTAISVRIEEEWLILLRHIRRNGGYNVNRQINEAVRDYLAQELDMETYRLPGYAHNIAPGE